MLIPGSFGQFVNLRMSLVILLGLMAEEGGAIAGLPLDRKHNQSYTRTLQRLQQTIQKFPFTCFGEVSSAIAKSGCAKGYGWLCVN